MKIKKRRKRRYGKPRAINITSDTMEVSNFIMTVASLIVEVLIAGLVAWELVLMLKGTPLQ